MWFKTQNCVAWVAACVSLLLGSACGVGIDYYPLLRGESFTLEFTGPVKYTYTSADGTPVNGVVENEEQFQLVNLYADNDTTTNNFELTLLYARLLPESLEFHFGYDPEVERPGSTDKAFTADNVNGFKTNALMALVSKGTLLNKDNPIAFNGNFTGVTLTRFERICMGPEGQPAGTVESCDPPNIMTGTGNLKERHFSKEDISDLLANNHNSQIASMMDPWGKIHLTFKVKNMTKPTEEKISAGATSSDLITPSNAQEETGGSCSLGVGTGASLCFGKGIWLLLPWLWSARRLLRIKAI